MVEYSMDRGHFQIYFIICTTSTSITVDNWELTALPLEDDILVA